MRQGMSGDTGVRSLFGDSVSLSSSYVVSVLLGLVSSVLSARILGKEGYGLIAFFGMVTGIISLITSNWTGAAVLRFGREEYDKSSKLNHTCWARNIILIPCFVFAFSVSYFFRHKIADYIHMPTWIVWLVMGTVLAAEAQNYVDYILQASHHIRFYAVSRVLRSVASTVGLAIIFWGVFSKTYLSVIAVGLCAGAISTFFVIIFLLPGRALLPIKTDRPMIKEVFLFSLPVFLGNVAAYIVNWIDVVFIKHYYSIVDVGGYQLAYNAFSLLDGIVGNVNVLMTPVLISLLAVKREDLIVHYGTRLVSQGVLLWTVLVGVGMGLSPMVFQVLYGKEFLISAFYFQFLAAGLFFSSLLYFYSGIITAYKLVKLGVGASIARAMVNSIGNLLLVPGMGPLGAALANTAGIGVAALIYLLICQRQLRKGLLQQLVLILPALASLGASHLLKVQGAPFLSVAGTLIAGYYVARAFHLFRSEDLVLLDYVKMPISVRRVIGWAYRFLARES